MCQHSSTQSRRAAVRGVVAAGALVFLLAGQANAVAQSNPAPAPITKAGATRQVGIWSVDGWNRGNVGSHCSAERPVRGAAPGGGSLQFALVRVPGGYRIALAADDWDLEPQSSFPVELIAPPVLQRAGNAVAVTPRIVVVDLGPSSEMMRRIAELPMFEIKTAQSAFKLPLDGFAAALEATDACFASLKRAEAPVQAKITQVSTAPTETPAATKTPVNSEPELIEEHTFLTVTDKRGTFRLEAFIVRPAKADGRLPIALITHGKNLKAEENQQVSADLFAPQARDFAMRGWLSVVVIRRGYGQSDGIPGVSRGAAYMSCQNADLVRGFDTEADDLAAALQALAARPDADASRVIAVGQSLGGGTVLAFAARRPAGLIGVVNVSGGVWRSDDNGMCSFDALYTAMATFGARTRVPTLWLYAENDSLFPPSVVAPMHAAYTGAGGVAKLWMLPPLNGDGHNLFADFGGRVKWLRALDRFMQAYKLPNTNVARAESVMSTVKLADNTRPVVDEYLSTPLPKLLVASPSGKVAFWVANPNDIDGARKRALARCKERAGADCAVVMENNDLVKPIVTGLLQGETAEN